MKHHDAVVISPPVEIPSNSDVFFKHRFVESFTVTTITAHHLRFFQKSLSDLDLLPPKTNMTIENNHLKMYLLFKHGDFLEPVISHVSFWESKRNTLED